MNQTNQNGIAARLIVPIQIADFAISWAGPRGRNQDFCFGSEDGRLRITNVDGQEIGRIDTDVENAEAVNGVAFAGPAIAISNRREVTFWILPQPGCERTQRAVFPCGAHGVLATAEGSFVAPLGRTGLMKVWPGRDEEQPVTVSRVDTDTFDYYRATSLYSNEQPEIIACATRLGGVQGVELFREDGQGLVSSITFPGLDVVDVCSLGTGVLPPAVAAVGRDGTLILLRDILHDRSPVTMSVDIPGVAYRVFCARGSILVLTSRGLYALAGLAERFLAGESVATTPTPLRAIPLEAVDANVCGERWLLVVLSNGALRIDLEILLRRNSTASEQAECERAINPTAIHPNWEPRREDSVHTMAVA